MGFPPACAVFPFARGGADGYPLRCVPGAEEERAVIERRLQETQKLESLGVLAGGIAHDFNNLLTSVLGNASLARLELPPESPAQESLAQIETGAQRAAELCKQMLAYSGRGRFVVRRLELSAVVRDSTEIIQLSISKKAVLKFALAKDLPAIAADATQLRQIVMNLVINASDAIAEKSGVIAISTGVMHADRPPKSCQRPRTTARHGAGVASCGSSTTRRRCAPSPRGCSG